MVGGGGRAKPGPLLFRFLLGFPIAMSPRVPITTHMANALTTNAGHETMIGKATYTNTVTKATYNLGFEVPNNETALGHAWDLVELVCRMNGWRAAYVMVKIND